MQVQLQSHYTNRADKRKQEAGTNAGADLANRDGESRWRSLGPRVAAKRVLGLGHADGQVVEALALVARNLLFCLVCRLCCGCECGR